MPLAMTLGRVVGSASAGNQTRGYINLAPLSQCGQNDATIGPPGVLRGDGRMYAFLLILGAVIAAAGVVLIGPGLPFGGRDYDASIVTPGAVAIVGGLILIGLALAVRVLGRIEKALAARPLPHPVLQEEEAAAPATEEPAAAAPARIPFPPKPAAEPAPPPAPAVATPRVLPEDAALERLREKFPTLVRLENAPVVGDADVSLSPKPSVPADDVVGA